MNGQKVLVFDLNGVFIFKEANLNDIEELKGLVLTPTRDRYLSPLISFLNPFLSTHSCRLVLWSTMMHKNIIKYLGDVQKYLGIEFEAVFSQVDCDEGEIGPGAKTPLHKKDLRKVAEKLCVDVNDCILIDDSLIKRVDQQNFHHFEFSKDGISKLLKKLDDFLECKDEECVAK